MQWFVLAGLPSSVLHFPALHMGAAGWEGERSGIWPQWKQSLSNSQEPRNLLYIESDHWFSINNNCASVLSIHWLVAPLQDYRPETLQVLPVDARDLTLNVLHAKHMPSHWAMTYPATYWVPKPGHCPWSCAGHVNCMRSQSPKYMLFPGKFYHGTKNAHFGELYEIMAPKKGAFGGWDLGVKSNKIIVTKMAVMLSWGKTRCPGFSETLVGYVMSLSSSRAGLCPSGMKSNSPNFHANVLRLEL